MDLRTITLGVPPQEVSQEPGGGPGAVQVRVQVLTKDSVTVSVDAVVYYRVSNATISVANVEDAHSSTRSAGNRTAVNEPDHNIHNLFFGDLTQNRIMLMTM